MNVQEVVAEARDVLAAKPIVAEPYEKNGTTVIPVTTVRGGGGGGGGDDVDGKHGARGGFGLRMQPAGAWVIQGDEVSWKPAVDVNRLNFGWQIVTLALIGVAGRVLLKRPQRHVLAVPIPRVTLPEVRVPDFPRLRVHRRLGRLAWR